MLRLPGLPCVCRSRTRRRSNRPRRTVIPGGQSGLPLTIACAFASPRQLTFPRGGTYGLQP